MFFIFLVLNNFNSVPSLLPISKTKFFSVLLEKLNKLVEELEDKFQLDIESNVE